MSLGLALTCGAFAACETRPFVAVPRDAADHAVPAPVRDVALIVPAPRAPHAPRPIDDPAFVARVDRLVQAEREIEAHVAGVAVPVVTAGGTAVQPYLRVVVTRTAIEFDDVTMLFAWRRTDLARVALVDAAAVEPISASRVVAIDHEPITDCEAFSAPLDALMNRVRAAEEARLPRGADYRGRPINVYADPEVSSSVVLCVLQSAERNTFAQYNLVEQRAGHDVVLALNVAGLQMPGAAAPLPVRLHIAPTGVSVFVGTTAVATSCADATGAPAAFPLPHGQADTADLSRCMATLRSASRWSARLATQFQISVAVDGRVPYASMLATIAAVEDATPGAHDLFIDPSIELPERRPGVGAIQPRPR